MFEALNACVGVYEDTNPTMSSAGVSVVGSEASLCWGERALPIVDGDITAANTGDTS